MKQKAIGTYGSLVTINGTGFLQPQRSDAFVSFNGITAAPEYWADNQILVRVPDGATTGPITVQVAGRSSSTEPFTIELPTRSITVEDSLGNETAYTSVSAGGYRRVSESSGPGCASCSPRGVVHKTFDSKGNVLTFTDALGHSTTYTYDDSNNLLTESVALDSSTTATTTYTYNGFGQVLTVADALGNVTTNQYDTKGNLLSVTSPIPDAGTNPSVTQFAYDSKGQLTQITDPLNRVTTLTYTPAGDVNTITDAAQNVTTYEYDARGNRTAVIDPTQHRTSFGYDSMNRLTGITYPDQKAVGFGYDTRGRRTSVTDQNGKTTAYTYDDADRLVTVTDAESHLTQYAYDTENNLLSITDAAGRVTSFEYDAYGRVLHTTFPSTLIESYVYDAIGNLTSKTDRRGQTITYFYDALNRLSSKQYPDSTSVEYVYDLVGKLQQVTDPSGIYSFAYDNIGRLVGTTTSYAFLPGKTFSNTYDYDADSNRTGLVADGNSNSYQYGNLNRLTNLTNPGVGVFAFGYDTLSRRTSLTRPNAVSTTYSYDSVSRLLSILHQAGGTTIDGASYGYDDAGNRISKNNHLDNTAEQYTYDDIYQLTQVAKDGSITENYGYDPVGNRLSSLNLSPYTYNSSNQLLSTPEASFTYDNNGNMFTKTDTTGLTTYVWDYENRLKVVTLPGGSTVSFLYDPFGRRIRKTSQSGTTIFAYDGAGIIGEYDSAGTAVARYTQGTGIDEPLAMLRSGTISYYHADGLGSVTSMTDASGSAVAAYTTDAFGKPLATAGTFNSFRYTGREWDEETGLYYYRARYYDPNNGRFLSEDPQGFLGGTNFYSYVNNAPLNWIDPTGWAPNPPGYGPNPNGPPVAVPGVPNAHWEWSPDSTNSRGGTWRPNAHPKTPGGIPSASWEEGKGGKAGHYDVDDGNRSRCRYDENGKPLTPGEAHPRKNPDEQPQPQPIPWLPPFRIPGPFPVIINPCLLDRYLPGCYRVPIV